MPSPFIRPNTHQNQSPEANQQQGADDHQHQCQTKALKSSCIPKLQCSTAGDSCPEAIHYTISQQAATYCPAVFDPAATSCIPTLFCSPSSRPSTHTTAFHNHIPGPSTMPPTINQCLAHLAAINDQQPTSLQEETNSPLSISVPTLPTSCEPSKTSSSQSSTCSQYSSSFNPDEASSISIESTSSDRQFQPTIPLSYNETPLK